MIALTGAVWTVAVGRRVRRACQPDSLMGQLASRMQQDGWEGRNEANRVSCSGVPSGAGRSSPEVCCSCMYMDGHGRTWTYTVERRVDAGSDYLGEGPSHARSCTRGSAGCSKVLTATARVQAKRQHGATEALFERFMAYIVDPTHSRPNGGQKIATRATGRATGTRGHQRVVSAGTDTCGQLCQGSQGSPGSGEKLR
jgi:hypothetical protein